MSGTSSPLSDMATLPLWLSLLALAALLPGLLVLVYRQNRLSQQLKRLKELELLVAQQQAQETQFRRSVQENTDELRHGAIAIGRRLSAVEQGLAELVHNQPEPEALEPERRLYRRAVRMVELGADLEEIIQECELPRAEAELVFNLHHQKQRQQ